MKQELAMQDIQKMTFNVSEIFSSLSGEGSTSGIPASFVRVFGCNLRCEYCDTKYSYNEEYKKMSYQEITQILKAFNNKIIVCTGGEPLLDKNNARILPLLLSNEGFDVYIETNGATPLYNEEELKIGNRNNIHYVLDIKTPISKMCQFDKLETNSPLLLDGDEIKCVVSCMEDIEFCKQRLLRVYEIIKQKKINIIFSPVFGMIELNTLAGYIMEMKELFINSNLTIKLGIQLHKLIWPNIEKGV